MFLARSFFHREETHYQRTSIIALLYASDGFHPTKLGSLLAAWVIFEKLYDDSSSMPAQLKTEFDKLKLTAEQLETLRLAAQQQK